MPTSNGKPGGFWPCCCVLLGLVRSRYDYAILNLNGFTTWPMGYASPSANSVISNRELRVALPDIQMFGRRIRDETSSSSCRMAEFFTATIVAPNMTDQCLS